MATEDLAVALVEASRLGDVQTLEALLTEAQGSDINFTTEGGVTLLMHAIIGAGRRIVSVPAHQSRWRSLPVSRHEILEAISALIGGLVPRLVGAYALAKDT